MLYQFMDIPAESSIKQIMCKRMEVVESLVIFMSDFTAQAYQIALKSNYPKASFTFANLLGTGHVLGKYSFGLDDFLAQEPSLQLLKTDDNRHYYLHDSADLVKVNLDDGEVLSVTYSYPSYLKTDYYCGKRIYSKQKNHDDESSLITFYHSDGSVFYTSSDEDSYTYKGETYTSKADFYKQLLAAFPFTKEDVLSMDWCHGFEEIVCQTKGEAKLVVPLHSEMFVDSSIYPRTDVLEHTHLRGELCYLGIYNQKRTEPFCELGGRLEFLFHHTDKIDAIYTQTEEMKDIFERHMEAGLLPKVKVDVYKLLDQKLYPNRSNGNKKICAVSRLSPEKRIDWIIKSVFFARMKDPEIQLDIYGGGPAEEDFRLKQLVKDLDAENYISFKGWVKDRSIIADYAVFMNTSLFEGLPLSVQEAVSCGCAIVGSDIVGHRKLVKDNGILVNFGGKTDNMYCLELSQAILEALERFDEFSRQSVLFASQELNKEVTDQNIKRLFS